MAKQKAAAKVAAKSGSTLKKKSTAAGTQSPAALIDARIAELGDWRGALLARLRAVIKAADREIVEEWKWNVPVWSRDGIICTGETYKSTVKLTFARGAIVDDPTGLFNSSLEGNTRRAIDFREGDQVDEKRLKALIRAAAEVNTTPKTTSPRTKPARSASSQAVASKPPTKKTKSKPPSPASRAAAKRKQASPERAAAPDRRATTIASYIQAAPAAGRPHLKRIYELLKSVAPQAEETIKWNAPFFIEPRFLFSFSACKAHLNFAPSQAALAPFREELKQHRTTANFLQVPYDEPLPEDLIRKIAETSLRIVSERSDDSFW